MPGLESDALHHLFQMLWAFTRWVYDVDYNIFGSNRGYHPEEAWAFWPVLMGLIGLYYYRRWQKRQDAKDRHADMRGAHAPKDDETASPF